MRSVLVICLIIISLQMVFAFEMNPPVNLTTEVIENDVNLTWEQPSAGEETGWIYRGNNTYGGSIAASSLTPWYVASPFSVEEMSYYSGSQLARVKFYPTAATANYSICVWTSPPWEEDQIVEYPVSNPIINNWTEVILPDPVEIIQGNELWIGYKVTQTDNNYVAAGRDTEPAEAGFWANFGAVWIDYSSAGFDHNWLLQGLLEDNTGQRGVINKNIFSSYSPINYRPVITHNIEQDLVDEPYSGKIQNIDNDLNRSLLGYNVYRDSVLIHTTTNLTELSFTDYDLSNATYSYYITANYDGGESAGSDVKYAIVYTPEISDLFYYESTFANRSLPDTNDPTISCYWQKFHPERSGALKNIIFALCPSYGISSNGVLSLSIYDNIGGNFVDELNFDMDSISEDAWYEFDMSALAFSFSAAEDFWIQISFTPDSGDDQLWFYCGAPENGIDVFYDSYSAFEIDGSYYWWIDGNDHSYDEINMIAEIIYEEELVYHESTGGICELPHENYGDINYWHLFAPENFGTLEKLKLNIASSASSSGTLFFDIFDERGGTNLGGLSFDRSSRETTGWTEFDMSSLNFSFQPNDEFWVRISFTPSTGSDVFSFYRGQFENGDDIIWDRHSYFEYNGSYSYWAYQVGTENWFDEINLTAIVDYDLFERHDFSVESISFDNFFLTTDTTRANTVYEALIKNTGTIPEYNVPIRLQIKDLTNNAYIPRQYEYVNLLPGESQTVIFDPWIYSDEGDYKVTISSYLSGDDFSSNNNIVIEQYICGQSAELKYDDDDRDNSYTKNSSGNGFANKFTPAYYPFSIDDISYMISSANWPDPGSNEMRAMILDDDGADNSPGTVLYDQIHTVTRGEWNTFDVSSQNIVLYDSSFFVAFITTADNPNCPGLGIDTDTPIASSYIGWDFQDGIWEKQMPSGAQGDWMIRASVSSTDFHDLSVEDINFNHEYFLPDEINRVTRIYSAEIKNNGTFTESNADIDLEVLNLESQLVVFSDTQQITLNPDETGTVYFNPWICSIAGEYKVIIEVDLPEDGVSSNDQQSIEQQICSYPSDLSYDDGLSESGSVQINPNNGFANYFIPPYYPYLIVDISYNIYSDSWPFPGGNTMRAQILDDDGVDNSPGTILYDEVQTIIRGQWNTFDISTENIILPDGGFYVAFIVYSSFPDGPALNLDRTEPFASSDVAWYLYNGLWEKKMVHNNYQQDWMIRSTVTYDELEPPEDIEISEINSEILLNWSKSPGAVSYKVSSGSESDNVSTLEESGIADTFWVDSEIELNDKKFYSVVATTSPSNQTRDIGILSDNVFQSTKLNSKKSEIISFGDVDESISSFNNQDNSINYRRMVIKQKTILHQMDSQIDKKNISEKSNVIGIVDESIIEKPKVEIKKYLRK
ncbi:MAG: hypothetical protein K8S23_05400 [Candidatus Cloacimonetes bacterium]|nr:hypothetical protein [Candidatus Cloacimonadota bacterium]